MSFEGRNPSYINTIVDDGAITFSSITSRTNIANTSNQLAGETLAAQFVLDVQDNFDHGESLVAIQSSCFSSGTGTFSQAFGGSFSFDNNQSGNFNLAAGISGSAENHNVGTANALVGVVGNAITSGDGVINQVAAGSFTVENSGNATQPKLAGIGSSVANSGAGVITDAVCLIVDIQNTGGGLITNGYGVRIDALAGANQWGFYNANLGSKNLIGGDFTYVGGNSTDHFWEFDYTTKYVRAEASSVMVDNDKKKFEEKQYTVDTNGVTTTNGAQGIDISLTVTGSDDVTSADNISASNAVMHITGSITADTIAATSSALSIEATGGSIAKGFGVLGAALATNTQPVDTLGGVGAIVFADGGAVIDTAVGYLTRMVLGTATVNNGYGFKVLGLMGTNQWGFYNDVGGSNNRFTSGQFVDSFSDPGSSPTTLLYSQANFNNSTDHNGVYLANYARAVYTGDNGESDGAMAGMQCNAEMAGNSNFSTMSAIATESRTESASTSNIDAMISVNASISHNGSGTITNVVGTHVDMTLTGGGTIATAYGFKVGGLAGTDQWSFFTDIDQKSFLGGETRFGGTNPATAPVNLKTSGIFADASGNTIYDFPNGLLNQLTTDTGNLHPFIDINQQFIYDGFGQLALNLSEVNVRRAYSHDGSEAFTWNNTQIGIEKQMRFGTGASFQAIPACTFDFIPTTILTSTSIGAHYVVLVNAAGGNVTATLPTAVGVSGRTYIIKRIDSSINTVTIATTGGQTIDGASTVSVLNTPNLQSYTVISDNANWWII